MAGKKHKGSHKAAFPIGMIIALLAAVGLVTIVVSAAKGIGAAVEKSKNYDEYNTLLTPVVLIDPDNFDDITKAQMSELLDISIWSLLRNSDITPDRYESGENGLVVPAEDVEEQFKKLFGTEITPVHATVEGYGYEFTYDEDAGVYNIPLTGIIPIYTPKVVDKTETSDTIVLTVACLAGEGWEQGDDGQMKEPVPDKYIKVTLREKDGNQYISAIQATTAPETATVGSTLPPETEAEPSETQTEEQTEESTSKTATADESNSTENTTET
ncbi:MAG: hypothetical protein J1F23_06130 [Oscillospiraceae bacterium]|nr:hypothetical protein [Oscillospiraceae bacterium]